MVFKEAEFVSFEQQPFLPDFSRAKLDYEHIVSHFSYANCSMIIKIFEENAGRQKNRQTYFEMSHFLRRQESVLIQHVKRIVKIQQY